MKTTQKTILAFMALLMTSVAQAKDPETSQTSFENIDPRKAISAPPVVGNFGAVPAATPLPLGAAPAAGNGHILQNAGSLPINDDFPSPPPASKQTVKETVSRMRLTTLPTPSTDESDWVKTDPCQFTLWVFGHVEPTDANILAYGIVHLIPGTQIKDLLLFTSRQSEPQNYAYSTVNHKFYKYDHLTNTLMEIATFRHNDFFNTDKDNAIFKIEGIGQFMQNARTLLGTAFNTGASVASQKLNCDDPNWFVQRLADTNYAAKPAAPAKAEDKSFWPSWIKLW